MLFGISACKKNTEESSENISSSASQSSASEITDVQSQEGKLNPLTGLYEKGFSAEGKRPIAVVVENSPAARPHILARRYH